MGGREREVLFSVSAPRFGIRAPLVLSGKSGGSPQSRAPGTHYFQKNKFGSLKLEKNSIADIIFFIYNIYIYNAYVSVMYKHAYVATYNIQRMLYALYPYYFSFFSFFWRS